MFMECDATQEFYSEKLVKARCRHRCCECRQPIEPGEQYYRMTGKWDGSLWSGCQHIYCWRFARSLNGHDSPSVRQERYDAAPRLYKYGGLNPWGFDLDSGCVPFEGVAECLSDLWEYCEATDERIDHPAKRFWDAMCSGCREVFEKGSGI